MASPGITLPKILQWKRIFKQDSYYRSTYVVGAGKGYKGEKEKDPPAPTGDNIATNLAAQTGDSDTSGALFLSEAEAVRSASSQSPLLKSHNLHLFSSYLPSSYLTLYSSSNLFYLPPYHMSPCPCSLFPRPFLWILLLCLASKGSLFDTHDISSNAEKLAMLSTRQTMNNYSPTYMYNSPGSKATCMSLVPLPALVMSKKSSSAIPDYTIRQFWNSFQNYC